MVNAIAIPLFEIMVHQLQTGALVAIWHVTAIHLKSAEVQTDWVCTHSQVEAHRAVPPHPLQLWTQSHPPRRRTRKPFQTWVGCQSDATMIPLALELWGMLFMAMGILWLLSCASLLVVRLATISLGKFLIPSCLARYRKAELLINL